MSETQCLHVKVWTILCEVRMSISIFKVPEFAQEKYAIVAVDLV